MSWIGRLGFTPRLWGGKDGDACRLAACFYCITMMA
jgi:hypothetical protein